MSSLITASRAAQTQPGRNSFPVPRVPLSFKVPAAPQWDIARLQRELLENTKPSSQKNGLDKYAVQIQPYPLQPLPLKIAEDVPDEKMDVTLKLVPLQFTRPPSK